MSYRKLAKNGAKWTTTSTLVMTLSQFLQMTVLARILGPTAFGLVGMVTVIINFLVIFSDMGVSNAIIYKQENNKRILSSLYWLNIIIGILLFCIFLSSKNLIIEFYQEPRLNNILIISAFIFLVVPLGQQFQFIFQKDLRFKELARIEIIASLIGTSIALLSAIVLEVEELSIIIGQLSMYTTKSFFLMFIGLKNWKPTLQMDLSAIKDYLKFGLYNMGDNLLNFLSTNLDYLIIGSLLGPRELGFYSLAYQLVLFPISKLNPILTRISFPIFSKIGNDIKLLKAGYLKVLNLIGFINFPLLIGLLVTSPVLIPIIYGDGWDTTVTLMHILCIVGLIRSIGNPLGSLLLSQGKPKYGFRLNLCTLLIQIPMLYLGAKIYGIFGVAIAFAIVQFLNIILNFYVVHLLIGNWLLELIKNLKIEIISSIIMGLVVLFFKEFFFRSIHIVDLAILIIIGVVIYFTMIMVLKKRNIRSLFNEII